jgi:4-carboxymuconolactone decarboxylase
LTTRILVFTIDSFLGFKVPNPDGTLGRALSAGEARCAATPLPCCFEQKRKKSMSRFKPLAESDMTPAQRAAAAELARGPRGKMNPNGPNALLLRSPDLMARTQKVGEYLRYSSPLPQRLRELAILVTARQWRAQVEWIEHHPLALKEGVDPAAAEDLRHGRTPRGLRDDEMAVYRFCQELHETHTVGDATFAAITERFGDQGAIDLIALTGYYTLLAMVLNVAQQPLPGGVAPPLPQIG